MGKEPEEILPDLPEYDKKPGDKGYNAFEDPQSVFYGLSPNWSPSRDRPVPTVRCARIKKDGYRCKNRAIRGAGLKTYKTVDENGELVTKHEKAYCRIHGGNLPPIRKHSEKVVDAARLALTDSVPDAVLKLVMLVNSGDAPEQVQLNAAKEILDRSGVKGGVDVNVTVDGGLSAYEKLQGKIGSLNRGKEEELEDLGEKPRGDVVDEEET